MDWDAWVDEVHLAKQEFARLINAAADEIAVFSSVSEATSAVASAIDFGGGRNGVVVTEAEFPTIGHVWLAQERNGARVTWVPVRDGEIDPASYDASRRRAHGDRLGVPRLLSERIHAGHSPPRQARARRRGAALRRRLPDARHTARRRASDGRRLPRGGESEIPHGHSRDRVPLRPPRADRAPVADDHRMVRSGEPVRLSGQAARLGADRGSIRHGNASGGQRIHLAGRHVDHQRGRSRQDSRVARGPRSPVDRRRPGARAHPAWNDRHGSQDVDDRVRRRRLARGRGDDAKTRRAAIGARAGDSPFTALLQLDRRRGHRPRRARPPPSDRRERLRQTARDLRLALRHAGDDHRRRHRPRERVALPVHGWEVRRRGVRSLLHSRLRRHRRARADGGVCARSLHAPRTGGCVRAGWPAVRHRHRLVLLRRRHGGHGLLHRRDRVGVVLRDRPARARPAHPARSVGHSAARHGIRRQVVRPATRLHRRGDSHLRGRRDQRACAPASSARARSCCRRS